MPERIEISIIPQDLRLEETIVQIAETLDDLNFAVTHIFDSLNQRINNNISRLSDIKSRATNVQGKLTYMKNHLNKKAIKLYSASKYPAAHVYKDYSLAVQPKSRNELHKCEAYKSPVPISDMPMTMHRKEENLHYSNSSKNEKLQFYFVKSKILKNPNNDNSSKPKVTSVDSLLIFNEQDTKSQNDTQSISNDNQIEDAPDSISQPWHASELESSSSYLYTPTVGEVPQLDIPLTLPDLPGIVDDEQFMLDSNFSSLIESPSVISPSKKGKNVPTIDQESKEVDKTPLIQNDLSTVPSSSNEPSMSAVTESTFHNLPKLPTLPAKVAPPPPPPPPPPPLITSSDEEEETISKKQPKKFSTPIASSDDRSNLMAAIRNAGGRSKLKPIESTDKSKDRWASASVEGDLMADLHATLALRRKGIANSSSNVLSRLSSMIPPPPKPNEASASDRNSATSESQDDEAWEE